MFLSLRQLGCYNRDDCSFSITKMDLLRYLDHVGLSLSDVTPIAEGAHGNETVLQRLQEAHLRSIPFNNEMVVRGDPYIPTIDAAWNRCIEEKTGDICYGHALLFRWVLLQLGFSVHLENARVWVGSSEGKTPPATHVFPVVSINGSGGTHGNKAVTEEPRRYIAYVGFGGKYRHLFLDLVPYSTHLFLPDGKVAYTIQGPLDESDLPVLSHYITTHPSSRLKKERFVSTV